MFKVGDAVVHPLHGAGIITGFKHLRQQDSQRYYTIELLGERKTSLMVPIQRATEAGLRTVIASADLDQVWQVLSATPVSLPEDYKTRYKMMNDKLLARETLDVAGVIRDMAWRQCRAESNLAQKGREIFQKSVRILAEEIAASRNISLEVAEDLIRTKINNILPSHYDA